VCPLVNTASLGTTDSRRQFVRGARARSRPGGASSLRTWRHIDDAGAPAPARARRARLGIAAEWRFCQVFRRCELRAVRQRTKSPGPRCSDQVINRKPWKQTQRPSETSPPRSQFIAPGSLRRTCGWQRASGAHYLFSRQINYAPHFVFRQRAQAVPGQNRSRNILRALDLHLHPMTSENVLSR